MKTSRITVYVSLSIAFLLLIVGAYLSHFVLFQQPIRVDSDYTKNIPQTIGRWSLIDVSTPSESEYRGLETKDIIKRTYSDGNQYIELVVAYIAHSNRKSAHAQEACLRGAGAMVGSIEHRNIANNAADVTSISVDYAQHKAWVYYWFKMGHLHSSRYLNLSWKLFLAGLLHGGHQGSALVRLLAYQNPMDNKADVQKHLEDFAENLIPVLNQTLP